MRLALIPALLVALSAMTANPDTAHSQELEMTVAQKAVTNILIRRSGFHCPAVVRARHGGLTARGPVMRVWCGPDGESGDYYLDFAFDVTVREDGSHDIEEVDCTGRILGANSC